MGTQPIGRPRGSKPTETDLRVIKQIAKEGFQTYSELRTEILRDYNRTHCWDLMKRLVGMGLLTEVRGDGGGIRGWSLSPVGQRKLHGVFEPSWKADRKPPHYRTAFDHDITLREVKQILCESPAVSGWTPEHVLKAEVMSKIKFLGARDRADKLLTIPDAFFRLQSGTQRHRAALEVELTRKSKKRIFKKMESHITSSAFDFVFFVVGGEKLLQLLWEIYNAAVTNSVRVKVRDQQNGIYFATLESLRAQRLEAHFKGLHGAFSFGRL